MRFRRENNIISPKGYYLIFILMAIGKSIAKKVTSVAKCFYSDLYVSGAAIKKKFRGAIVLAEEAHFLFTNFFVSFLSEIFPRYSYWRIILRTY